MRPAPSVQFETMQPQHLDAVSALDQQARAYPWQRQHFADCLSCGYPAQVLMNENHVLGYFVVMKGFEEAHLLNMAVAPEHQRQGYARIMLNTLTLWADGQNAQWLWLEVRASNTRALNIYTTHGFRCVGSRPGYYPCANGLREDASVMNLSLCHPATIAP